jgi:hypothetical protein
MTDQSKYTYTEVDKEGFLKPEDSNILSSFEIATDFNYSTDKVELYVYSFDGSLLLEEINYNRFRVVQEGRTSENQISTLEIDPVNDAIFYDFSNGDVNLSYNFIRKITDNNSLFIESISPDRTEILLYSVNLTDAELISIASRLSAEFLQAGSLPRLALRIDGENYLQIINIGVIQAGGRDYLKVKLYQSLPAQFTDKTNTSLVRIVSEPVEYSVTRELIFSTPSQPTLRGPNFDVDIQLINSNPTPLLSDNDIISGSSSLIYSKVAEPGAEINVDYSDYNSFVHFSSAQERLNNFQYKLFLIEEYESSGSTDKAIEVFSGFDHYDRFLYFNSGSDSWPKFNNKVINPTGSAAIAFFNSQSLNATLFDETNPHRLLNTIPSFLKDDPNNQPYNLFIDMIGQHFDNVWLYAKGMTDRYDGDNRVDYGISKDLVADALRGFGIKLYGSSLNLEGLFTMFSGSGIITGSELINTAISASNVDISVDDYQKEIYKRMYHNTPLLLKSKGTERGLRTLLNVFGIPKNLLDIRLYGGQSTDVLPFYGPFYSVTGSNSKIRLDNTGSIYESTLSENTFITQLGDKYTQDTHLLEVGFSPSNEINKFLTIPSFELTGYLFSTDTQGLAVNTVGSFISLNKQNAKDTNIVYINTVGSINYTSTLQNWLSGSNLSLTILSGSKAATFTVTGSTFKSLAPYPNFELQVINGYGDTFNTLDPVSIQLRPFGTNTLIPSSFDIDEYIGDPNLYNKAKYTDLHKFAESIFSGSIERYNVYDFVRLLKYYDNTLFKMVKDFTPARTNTSTGLIIKPHILERNKTKSVEVSFNQPEFSGSIKIGEVGGTYGLDKTGEGYNPPLSSSTEEQVRLPQGGFAFKIKPEGFYDGEFANSKNLYSLSKIVATSRELNEDNVFKRKNIKTFNFKITLLTDDPEDLGLAIDSVTHISP